MLVLLAFLAGCSAMEKSLGGTSADGVLDPVRNADLRARPPAAGDTGGRLNPTLRPLIVPGVEREPAPSGEAGSGPGAVAVDSTATVASGAGIEFNFDGADVPTVAKTILGDVLGLRYAIDPRAQGSVTMVSAGPIPRKDVLPILEDALRMGNIAIVRDNDLIRIVPLGEATGSGSIGWGAAQPGFGVSIVSLRYASATALAKTMEGFLARGGAVRADQARNVLLIQGTATERQSALDAIASFDVEWLRNQSVGVYPLKSNTPETMIQELGRIFDAGENGQGQGVIRFQPVSRMNAVLVVAKSPKMLERVTQWVRRLDRSDAGGNALRTYELKYGNARRVAKILNDIFVGRQGGAAGTPADQSTSEPTAAQSRFDSLGKGGFSRSTSNGSTPSSSAGTDQSAAGSGIGGRAGTMAAGFEGFSGVGQNAEQDDKDTASLAIGSMPRGLFQNVRITADAAANSIVIYSNQEDFRIIEHALQDIDVPQLQVAIDATVAEVTLTDDLKYGVQHYLTSADLGAAAGKGSAGLFPTGPSSSTSSSAATAATQFLARVLPGFNLVLGPEAQPRFVLSALSTITDVKVLSSPSLLVIDDQPAVLEVGDQIPVTTSTATLLTSSNTPVVNTIEMRNTGVILKVLPHIHANGTVQLEVEQEISNVVNPNQQTLTPTIAQRRIHSTIVVTSGQTVLLGGLISEQQDNSKAGMPGLNQIKYLGDILGNASKDRQRSEIIVFIRPQVVRNGVDAQAVTEEFRARLETMRGARSINESTDLAPAARAVTTTNRRD